VRLMLHHKARVNSKYLREHVGQTVRLVAKVINIHADTATVEASDGGQVSLTLLDDDKELTNKR